MTADLPNCLPLPLKKVRIALLSLATTSCIIAGAAGVNAIRKSNTQKASIRKSLPSEIKLTIATSDIEDTIIVLFVVTNLLSMQIGNFVLMLLKDCYYPYWPPQMTRPRNGIPVSTRTLAFQSWYMVINLGAIVAVLIPATLFTARRMPDVKVFIGGTQLPDGVVQSAEAKLGFAGVYWHYFPVRFVIVSNWINSLFTLAATISSFIALYHRNKLVRVSEHQESSFSFPGNKADGEKLMEVRRA